MKICPPAMTYFIISTLLIFLVAIQTDFSKPDSYCILAKKCTNSDIYLFFTIKILYVLFWTWVLNLICKMVSPNVAWFVVLLPLIIFVVIILSIFLPFSIYP
jgi:hypothetical protein